MTVATLVIFSGILTESRVSARCVFGRCTFLGDSLDQGSLGVMRITVQVALFYLSLGDRRWLLRRLGLIRTHSKYILSDHMAKITHFDF